MKITKGKFQKYKDHDNFNVRTFISLITPLVLFSAFFWWLLFGYTPSSNQRNDNKISIVTLSDNNAYTVYIPIVLK